MRAALLLLLLALPAAVWGADEPQVRVELEQTGPIYVGQSLRLNVTVLVPNYFLSAPQFPLFDLPGAVVTMPGGGSANLNEKIDGVTYAGIKRTYLIVPQQAGTLVLPPAEISFQYAAVPGQSSPGSVKLPPEKIDVLLPPGAKTAQGGVAVAPMTIKQQVEGLTKPMHVGDAITRTIEIDADHTQSMMIRPSSFTAPAGAPRIRGRLLRAPAGGVPLERPGPKLCRARSLGGAHRRGVGRGPCGGGCGRRVGKASHGARAASLLVRHGLR